MKMRAHETFTNNNPVIISKPKGNQLRQTCNRSPSRGPVEYTHHPYLTQRVCVIWPIFQHFIAFVRN